MRCLTHDGTTGQFHEVTIPVEPLTLLLCVKPRSASCYRVSKTLNMMNARQKTPLAVICVVFGKGPDVRRYLKEWPVGGLRIVGMSSPREWFVGEEPLAIFIGADGRIAQRGEVRDLFAVGRFVEGCQAPALWRWFSEQPYRQAIPSQ